MNICSLVLSGLLALNVTLPMTNTNSSEIAYFGLTEWSVGHGSYKCYMDYRCITDTSSPQWELQQGAWTDENGLRKVGDRYCVALGSAFGSTIGTEYTIELETGEMLRCVLADQKADQDTNAEHTADMNGAVIEFVVDTPCLPSEVRSMGDISYINGLKGKVSKIYRDEQGTSERD